MELKRLFSYFETSLFFAMITTIPPKIELALGLYETLWHLLTPLLKFSPRLKDGYESRCSAGNLVPADIWIHAASAGEAYLASSLMEMLNPQSPVQVLITTNTRQGFDIIKKDITSGKKYPAVSAMYDYIPFDRPGLMQKAVRKVSPRVMVLLETEIWPGLLFSLKKMRIRTAIINGRLTPKSLKRYLIWPSLWQALGPDHILAISDADAKRFAAIFGSDKVQTMSNIKFDRLNTIMNNGSNPIAAFIPDQNPFLVLGSVRQPEEEQVAQIIRQVHSKLPDTITGLFPRHMQRINNWSQTLDHLHVKWTLRSALNQHPAPPGTVILWDVFGELNAAYSLAKAVFVGGSLAPLGGQNFLEPMIHGITPVIGPSWENFAWAGDELFKLGLAVRADTWQSVSSRLIQHLQQPKSVHQKKTARDYIEARKGGTLQACRLINELINQPRPIQENSK